MPKLRPNHRVRVLASAACCLPLLLAMTGCATRPLGMTGGPSDADAGVVRMGEGTESAVARVGDVQPRRGLFEGRMFRNRNEAESAEEVGIVQTGGRKTRPIRVPRGTRPFEQRRPSNRPENFRTSRRSST